MTEKPVTKALRGAAHQLFWGYLKWLLLLALGVYALSGIYKIEQDAIGVLTRFGRIVEPRVSPGLHYKLPWPIDRADAVPVKQVKTLVIQDFGSKYAIKEGGTSYSFYKNTNLEPYCITGDNNIVAITLVIKYTIDDPVQYLYGLKQPEAFMERCAAALIVHHLARLHIDEVLTHGKKQLEFNLQQALVEALERHATGLRISFLEIKEIKPPKKVQDAFDRVINAEVDKKKVLNQAQGYLNRIVPEARTAADRIIQEASAYKREKILTAEGEAARFLSRLEGFKENPDAHREKIYLEFIRTIYPQLKEIRVVKSQPGNTPLLIPMR
jgi:membrane protease subunit HflK